MATKNFRAQRKYVPAIAGPAGPLPLGLDLLDTEHPALDQSGYHMVTLSKVGSMRIQSGFVTLCRHAFNEPIRE